MGAVVAPGPVGWLWPILMAGALVLPYVAVVMANAATTEAATASRSSTGLAARELAAGSSPDP